MTKRECYCCLKKTPVTKPRICPECGKEFAGKSWEGIDAHWKSEHEHIMPYEVFWNSLCDDHRSGIHEATVEREYLSTCIRSDAYQKLRKFAEEDNISIDEMLEKILAAYERDIYFKRLNADFSALRSDPEAWRQELEERKVWDAGLSDDLDDKY